MCFFIELVGDVGVYSDAPADLTGLDCGCGGSDEEVKRGVDGTNSGKVDDEEEEEEEGK